ncbi:GNAT family N-acetyltransferase [Streptomyces sp. NPDC057682]|uniref:GNAT family N-acetyltransferase n=1 Tax=unclassified Streptomyces TaxID=2593676 RepID=UPI0036607907
MRIRTARSADLPLLQDIERAAGEPFRALGMAAVADDAPPPLDLLDAYRADGRARVVTGDDDRPLGYLLVDRVDGCAHVEQVSVHPSAARRGLGRALIDDAERWAVREGLEALTLTTFRDVPWNAPYYARLGFRVLDGSGPDRPDGRGSARPNESGLTEGLRAIRAAEVRHGLDRWPRVCMRRDVPQLTGTGRPH